LQHVLGRAGVARLASEFAVVGLGGVEQQKRVAGGRGIEHHKTGCAGTDDAGEGAEHRDLLGAGRAQVLFEQGAAFDVEGRALLAHDLRDVGGGFGGGVDAADGEVG
jgi:hypothetical protein